MTLKQVGFIDNDQLYSIDELMSSDVTDHYDTEIRTFLLDWVNSSDTISASTSGSTGSPKIIELTKVAMIASANATIKYFNLKKDQSVLLCLPTKFIAGKMMLVRALCGELKIIIAKPSTNPIIELTFPIDFAAMTPHQVTTILEQNPSKLNWINTLIIGGGPVDQKLHKKLQNITTQCYATYGMTETVSHVALKKLNGTDQSDIYEAISGVKFSQGLNNNLIIDAPHLSKDQIETNDIVELADQTHFKWIGRLDFVINSGGVKLHPEQIEKKLENIIDNNFFIWKEEDEKLGEKIVLVIESKSHLELAFKNVLDPFEIPRSVYFTAAFIRTQNGKVDRRETFRQVKI